MDKPELIRSLIRKNYIKSVAVEKALMKVKREDFIPDDQTGMTYYDIALSIPASQTISAPSMITTMLELAELKHGLKVLEIGTGSGYNAALMAEIVGEENVTSIERIPELVKFGSDNLERAGYNIKVVEGDGSLGYKKEAPYDRIIVTAAAPRIPFTWEVQLKPEGLIVAPIGGRHFYQEIIVAKKDKNNIVKQEKKMSCIFVPLIGEEAFIDY